MLIVSLPRSQPSSSFSSAPENISSYPATPVSFSRASNSADPDGSVQVKILMQKKKTQEKGGLRGPSPPSSGCITGCTHRISEFELRSSVSSRVHNLSFKKDISKELERAIIGQRKKETQRSNNVDTVPACRFTLTSYAALYVRAS